MRTRPRLAALLTAISALASACAPGSSSSAPAITITATNFQFTPSTLTVATAATVNITFVNSATVAHSFTVSTLNIDTPAQPGETQQINFSAPRQSGTFTWHCSFHPNMTGLITVTSASGSPAGIPPPTANGGAPGYGS